MKVKYDHVLLTFFTKRVDTNYSNEHYVENNNNRQRALATQVQCPAR